MPGYSDPGFDTLALHAGAAPDVPGEKGMRRGRESVPFARCRPPEARMREGRDVERRRRQVRGDAVAVTPSM